nr:PREDICTED: maestro heat-like repeat family member 5 [Rhinolophus sinicus]
MGDIGPGGPQDQQPWELGRAPSCRLPSLGPKEAPLPMVAAPSDGFHRPHWRSSLLSPTEEEEQEELDVGHPGRAITVKPLSDRPPWEKALMDRVGVMSATEKSLLLEAICHHIQEHDQEEVSDACVQELLVSLNLDLKQPLEKTLLFYIYGLVLRECPSVELVKKHLAGLLELSQQSSSQQEDIALAIGITSSAHMEVVWSMLEHLGRTRSLTSSFTSPDSQQPDPNTHWKWVGSMSLLCYGQMATHAGERVLPWVDNLVSRMVYYSCSSDDNTLKRSFLSATIMLTRALRWENSTQSYKFTQIPELIHCLLGILQKEPNFLATLFRQKIILVIVGLSLRPSLKPMVKSRILQTCLESLYKLPPTEMLKNCLPPQESVPDVMVLYQKSMQALDLLLQTFISENKTMDEVCFLLQHTEPWLKSDKSYERKRVVQSIFLLLKYVLDCVVLTEEAMPSVLGHQIGLLMLLCRDKDEVTWTHSRQCVCLLLQLLIQQKGHMEECMHLHEMKTFEARACRESEVFYHLVKALDENLSVAQHTQLVLTFLHGLCSHSLPQCDLASQLLLMVSEDHSIKQEQVAEVLQGLFQELPGVLFNNILQTMMKVVAVLGAQHTQETVEVMLSLCHPSERQVTPLWKALATNDLLARKVVTLLYLKLKQRPPKELLRFSEQVQLTSLLALDTIYELLYMREYKATVHWAFAGILLGLLTQLHYLFELGMVDGITDYQEDVLEMTPLSPCRTCLEALKGLFWTTNHWEVFADLKLLQAWELFEHLATYTEGVTLLAKTMAQYDCEIKAVFGQSVILLTGSEARDNIVAIVVITEHVSRKSVDNFLSLGLNNPNQLVRAMSLQGLRSVLMHPKKVDLLQSRLARVLDSFLRPEPQNLLGLMEVVGDILHHLGLHGVGAVSLKIAQHLRKLFDDEREDVRGGAIFLYGNVIYSGGKKHQQMLRKHAFWSLVPLLFHLADSCPAVVRKTKSTFLRCAILLKWQFRKELFSKLAWGHGQSAENDIFVYMGGGVVSQQSAQASQLGHVESNFASYHKFLMQALVYLSSPHRHLKMTAMKFIGGILQDYFSNLCFSLKTGDVKILRKQFEVLKQEQDSICRKFYQNHLDNVIELFQNVAH